MKSVVAIAMGVLLLVPALALAQGAATNQWGPVSCGARLSLQRDFKPGYLGVTNEIAVTATVSNVSDKPIRALFEGAHRDYMLTAVLPNGTVVSPPRPPRDGVVSRFMETINPEKAYSDRVDLRQLLDLRSPGTYRITVKRSISVLGTNGQWEACELVSNELKLQIPQPK